METLHSPRKRTLALGLGLLATATATLAQPVGYYNGTQGLAGQDLKAALHDIIDEHVAFQYVGGAEAMLKHSDQDPANPANVLTIYAPQSVAASTFGSVWNREHVWAKSHGDFGTEKPTGSDVHNLKPSIAAVNTLRSNRDFDNGGNPVPGAAGNFYDADSWEPRDAVKGDVARIILYMATRYEGDVAGEIDLEPADAVNTYPQALHGKLSTLLQWHEQDPPDAFERQRNDRIFLWQKNRNPFIDHPEFVARIWQEAPANPLTIEDLELSQDIPVAGQSVTLSFNISSESLIQYSKIYWGSAHDQLENEADISGQESFTFTNLPAGRIYFQIEALDELDNTATRRGEFAVQEVFEGTLVSISAIQGQAAASPYADQTVSTSGIVTANFGTFYFLQDGTGAWNGVMVYDPGRNPEIGDSLIITAKVKEYYNLTEMAEISKVYLISQGNELPAPVELGTGQVPQEDYEGVLVTLRNATCTVADHGYGMWKVNDGTGECIVHNSYIHDAGQTQGSVYNITGPLNYDFSEFKIELRGPQDATVGDFALMSAEALSATTVALVFTREVDAASASTISNYSINNGITVTAASRHFAQKSRVLLTVQGMGSGTHTVEVNGILSTEQVELIDASADFNFTATSLAELDGTWQFRALGQGQFWVEMPAEIRGVEIFNMLGAKVFASNPAASSATLSLSALASGVHLARFTLADGRVLDHRFFLD